MANRVLIANDDKSSLNLLHRAFKQARIESDLTNNAESIVELIKQREYDCVIVDTNIKGTAYNDIVLKVHDIDVFLPVVITGSNPSDDDIIKSIDLGADEYIIKPISTIVLVARVRAIIRRYRHSINKTNKIIVAGPFIYDTATLKLFKNKKEIQLSSKENSIVKLLLDNVNEVFTKDMIYSNVWGETIIDENAIMVYVNRIRQKIEDDPKKPRYIQTIRGIGYRFNAK